MRNSVEFTHLITGKRVTIVDPTSVSAVIHGPTTDSKGHQSPNENVWLIIDKVPNPIPVRESEEEVLVKLGLKEKHTHE